MKITHYTLGYGGKLNYHTICGKEIHSHSDTESASIDPEKVTCKDCRKVKEWITDLNDKNTNPADIKRRIFIESDVLHASALQSAQWEVEEFCEQKGEKHVRRVFSDILDYAWHDLEKTWEAVKKADEIYADSALMPLSGGSYNGAPVIFNGMCERAIKEGVTGKSVIILRPLKEINWGMIDGKVMKKAFVKNKLFMYAEDRTNLIQIDVKKLKVK